MNKEERGVRKGGAGRGREGEGRGGRRGQEGAGGGRRPNARRRHTGGTLKILDEVGADQDGVALGSAQVSDDTSVRSADLHSHLVRFYLAQNLVHFNLASGTCPEI